MRRSSHPLHFAVRVNPRLSAFIRVPVFLALVIGVVACGRSPQPIVIAAVATATSTPAPTLWLPSPTLAPRSTPTPSVTPAGWETIREGVQIRQSVGFENGRGTYVYALRLDPARVDVRLRYDPERPLRVSGWFAAEQPPSARFGDLRPIAALNAGFFKPDNTPVGRWVIDGTMVGGWHRLMQGELHVSSAGLSIHRLVDRHLVDTARVVASVESYPLLLLPGGIVNPCLKRVEWPERFGRPCARSQRPAERLVAAKDGAGHLVFILFPSETFTLRGLAEWLNRSDFNLDVALNLDGGSSAGMLVQAGDRVWGEDSGRQVPGAIVVLPKEFSASGGESP